MTDQATELPTIAPFLKRDGDKPYLAGSKCRACGHVFVGDRTVCAGGGHGPSTTYCRPRSSQIAELRRRHSCSDVGTSARQAPPASRSDQTDRRLARRNTARPSFICAAPPSSRRSDTRRRCHRKPPAWSSSPSQRIDTPPFLPGEAFEGTRQSIKGSQRITALRKHRPCLELVVPRCIVSFWADNPDSFCDRQLRKNSNCRFRPLADGGGSSAKPTVAPDDRS